MRIGSSSVAMEGIHEEHTFMYQRSAQVTLNGTRYHVRCSVSIIFIVITVYICACQSVYTISDRHGTS